MKSYILTLLIFLPLLASLMMLFVPLLKEQKNNREEYINTVTDKIEYNRTVLILRFSAVIIFYLTVLKL